MVKQKTMAQIPALLLSGTVGVLMAYNGMSYWGIATQTLTFITVVNLSFWYFSPWRPTFHINFRPLKSMFGFSSKILVTNIFTQANNNILSTLLGRFFTEQEVGYYTQSNKWNTMGYSFISGTVSSVAQPVLTEVSNDPARQLGVLRKMLRFTAFLSFPAMLGLAFIAREFIVITITEKWLPCVPMLQMLCIWGAFMPIITLYSNLVISKGKSNIYHRIEPAATNCNACELSLRYCRDDTMFCLSQYSLVTRMAVFCLERNTLKLLDGTEGHTPVCHHRIGNNGNHLVCDMRSF